MNCYLVRSIKNDDNEHDHIGVCFARNEIELFWVIDISLDPHDMEFTSIDNMEQTRDISFIFSVDKSIEEGNQLHDLSLDTNIDREFILDQVSGISEWKNFESINYQDCINWLNGKDVING